MYNKYEFDPGTKRVTVSGKKNISSIKPGVPANMKNVWGFNEADLF